MTNTSKYNLLTILGPTASGKTRIAAELAAQINGEIISADSRQVYRYMNLGTGKDYDDYTVNEKIINTHLIDIHDPGYKYNVFEFQTDFIRVYKEIIKRNNIAILCGGTGMYLEAVLKSYKLIAVPVNQKLRNELEKNSLAELEDILSGYKKLHNKTDTGTKKRAIRAIEIEEYYLKNTEKEINCPDINPLLVGVRNDRNQRRKRITQRLNDRLDKGMVDEVKKLLEMGLSKEDLIYYGLEYKFITLFLTGELSYAEMVERLNIAIHQFAKRQMTWFRKMEREGAHIHWFDGHLSSGEIIRKIKQLWFE